MNRVTLFATTLLVLACSPPSSFACQMADYLVAFPESGKVQVTYRVPSPSVAKNSSKQFGLGCPQDDGYSNPNLICYDEQYLELFVKNRMNGSTICGSGSYTVLSSDGVEVVVDSGLDESYLGKNFREADLLRYLERRIAGTAVARQVTMAIPENQLAQFKTSKLWFAKQFQCSPWETDTQNVISLLSKSQLESTIPVLVKLTEDSSVHVRYQALMGLGKLSQEHESAAKFLFEQLDHNDSKVVRTAVDGLRYGKGKATPYLVKAMKNSHLAAFEALSTIENSLTVAEEGWLSGLTHRSPDIRKSILRRLARYQNSHPQEVFPDSIENIVSRQINASHETRENRQLAASILKQLYKETPTQVEIK